MDMTASGVPRPVPCVFATEGVYPATLAPAPLSPALGMRVCSPLLESAAPSVAAMENLAPGREQCTETVKSGSPASVPDVSAATGKHNVQLQSVSKWPANRMRIW